MDESNFNKLIQPDRLHWDQLLYEFQKLGIKQDSAFVDSLRKLAVGSNYAVIQLAKYPQFIRHLQKLEHFQLEAKLLISAIESANDLEQVKRQLRLFRHQKLIEIIYLDICKNEHVQDTLLHLSKLADLLIQQAVIKSEQILSTKHGKPVDKSGYPIQLNIIGMGKLGGHELNFSSDIDLICSYSEDGQLNGFGKLSHNQYFTQVVKYLMQCLHETTQDGFVYRVDLRLRPWGDAGPLVLNHNAFEHYYQLHGREWEQYAMVKARIITGSDHDMKHLQSIIKPFVYRRYHDYRIFDGLTELKTKIDHQSKNRKTRNNVKIGRGGIREIEFFVQAFQILKGGRNNKLQTQSLFKAIEIISEQQITDPATIIKMRESYCFLRLLENRLQMFNDLQTHEIPQNENTLERLCHSMNYSYWQSLEEQLKHHQDYVNKIFASLFTPHQSSQQTLAMAQNLEEMSEEQHFQVIQDQGFTQALQIHQRLLQFYQSRSILFMSKRARQRFQVFFPELLQQIPHYQHQLELLEKLLALLAAIAGRSAYFELLYINIPLLVKLVNLFDSSNWIASEVTRHPILLESMLLPDQLEDRFSQQKLQQALKIQLGNVVGDTELELDILRQIKRTQTLMIASAEIAAEISTTRVSRYLTELAEVLLQAVYELSLNEMVAQYGKPQCEKENTSFIPTLAIIGYGKLGGNELHYQSDLDIIFLHNSSGSKQYTNGIKSIDNAVFFSRLAQKIISKISLLTAAGKLYEIDTRLRPNGASGMLVSSLQAYEEYQLNKAWIWEHQAIIKARFIAGDNAIQPEFSSIRQKVIRSSRNESELKKTIISMREKMYKVKKPPEGQLVNVKHSHGCMVDIEFLVQYWILKHANKFASLTESTDNIGLISELHRLDLISTQELQLRDYYPAFHKWLHARVLQNQSAEISSDLVRNEIDSVKACWHETFK